jgi:hypothetical protein
MTRRQVDLPSLKKTLGQASMTSISDAIKLLDAVEVAKTNGHFGVPIQIPISDLLNYSYRRENLENALEVLKYSARCILINQRASEDLGKKGVISVYSGSGEISISDSYLDVPDKYPTHILVGALEKIVASREEKLKSTQNIELILDQNRGLYRKDNERLCYKVSGKRMQLLALFADDDVTKPLLTIHIQGSISGDDSEFNVKDAVRKINLQCEHDLALNNRLIIGEKGYGYSINNEKYTLRKK